MPVEADVEVSVVEATLVPSVLDSLPVVVVVLPPPPLEPLSSPQAAASAADTKRPAEKKVLRRCMKGEPSLAPGERRAAFSERHRSLEPNY
jgi:hypothetical protein